MRSLIELVVIGAVLVSLWKVFEKCGKPGWTGIIPIYNLYILLQIIGKPTWWIILCLIPGVNIVIAIFVHIEVAKCFGKEPPVGFALGLTFLPFIFLPILAFSEDKFRQPAPPAQS